MMFVYTVQSILLEDIDSMQLFSNIMSSINHEFSKENTHP